MTRRAKVISDEVFSVLKCPKLDISRFIGEHMDGELSEVNARCVVTACAESIKL